MVRRRADVLDLVILGLLRESEMHGYALRKRVNLVLGPLRALSYGSLYPALRDLAATALIEATDAGLDPTLPPSAMAVPGRRARVSYRLTESGRAHLERELDMSGPTTWEDESFTVRFSLFAHTGPQTRLRILEGRRARLVERLELVRNQPRRGREQIDDYAAELQRHTTEQVERDIAWLDELIDRERGSGHATGRPRSPLTDGKAPSEGSEEQ